MKNITLVLSKTLIAVILTISLFSFKLNAQETSSGNKEFVVTDKPQFLDGNYLGNAIAQNFDSANFNSSQTSGVLKTMIIFNISKDGTIKNLKTEGENIAFNEEVLKTAKKVIGNKKWKPTQAEKDQPIVSFMKLPFTMSFD